jgi:hypothetical protein
VDPEVERVLDVVDLEQALGQLADQMNTDVDAPAE